MNKVKQLNTKRKKKIKKPNYDKFFESVVTDCANIIVDSMVSSEKGDNLNYKSTFEDKDGNKHKIQIIINKVDDRKGDMILADGQQVTVRYK